MTGHSEQETRLWYHTKYIQAQQQQHGCFLHTDVQYLLVTVIRYPRVLFVKQLCNYHKAQAPPYFPEKQVRDFLKLISQVTSHIHCCYKA